MKPILVVSLLATLLAGCAASYVTKEYQETQDSSPKVVAAIDACNRDLTQVVDRTERNGICKERFSLLGNFALTCVQHYASTLQRYGKPKAQMLFLFYTVAPACVLRERPDGLPDGVPAFHELSDDQRLSYQPINYKLYASGLKEK